MAGLKKAMAVTLKDVSRPAHFQQQKIVADKGCRYFFWTLDGGRGIPGLEKGGWPAPSPW